MKLIVTALLAVAVLSLRAADTNAPSTPHVETRITSKTVEFDLDARRAVYRDNVRVEDPRITLTCQRLIATLPEGGGRVDTIIAEKNVEMFIPDKGETNHATADKVVYNYSISGRKTNETLQLTGSPVIESKQGRLEGDPITWDKTAGTFKATNQRMTFWSQPGDSTNNPAMNVVPENKPNSP